MYGIGSPNKDLDDELFSVMTELHVNISQKIREKSSINQKLVYDLSSDEREIDSYLRSNGLLMLQKDLSIMTIQRLSLEPGN